jgi:hypothetical protein
MPTIPPDMPLSEPDIVRLEAVLGQSWSTSTCATYSAGLLAFHIFCNERNIPEPQCAPVHPHILQAFIFTMAGSFSHSIISSYVQGICAWHVHHSISWDIPLAELNILLNAARRLALTSSSR